MVKGKLRSKQEKKFTARTRLVTRIHLVENKITENSSGLLMGLRASRQNLNKASRVKELFKCAHSKHYSY